MQHLNIQTHSRCPHSISSGQFLLYEQLLRAIVFFHILGLRTATAHVVHHSTEAPNVWQQSGHSLIKRRLTVPNVGDHVLFSPSLNKYLHLQKHCVFASSFFVPAFITAKALKIVVVFGSLKWPLLYRVNDKIQYPSTLWRRMTIAKLRCVVLVVLAANCHKRNSV